MFDPLLAGPPLAASLEAFGRALVERFGPLTLFTGVLLVVAAVIDRLLSRRVRASLRVLLYAPVALRVLVPLGWRFQVAAAPRVETIFAPLAVVSGRTETLLPAWQASSGYLAVTLVYAVGLSLLAARAIVTRVRLRRALVDARPIAMPSPLPCPVYRHDALGPMTVGTFAPRIVVPRRLFRPEEADTLACVLRHEVAHVRRRDAWVSLGLEVLTVAAWPVVPLWIAAARVRQLMELACDEAALVTADAAERRRYGHALLDMAEWHALAVTPSGAGALHFGSTLRARIEALAPSRRWPRWVQALALSLASIVMLVACGGAAPAPAAPAAASTARNDSAGYGYAFDVDSAKAAAASSPNAPPAAPSSPTPGRVAPEAIQALVRAHLGDFQSCYAAGLAETPSLSGIVSVKIVFGADGVTEQAADEKSTLPNAGVVSCVVGAFQKLRYPAGGEGPVTVVYPLQFTP